MLLGFLGLVPNQPKAQTLLLPSISWKTYAIFGVWMASGSLSKAERERRREKER